LSQIEQEPGGRFVRVHRNCLVAAARIRGAERQRSGDEDDDAGQWAVLLDGYAEPIPVSRRQWSAIKPLVRR
jgi:two-component system response regulator AlgR